MADLPVARRLLFISNGHGEDSIAAAIIRQLPRGFVAEAYPTLGSGNAFRGVCPVVGPRAALRSEGWRNTRLSLARDIGGGGLTTILPGLQFLRRVGKAYDKVAVVGDLVGVAGGWAAGLRGLTYLDVYKTGAGRLYSQLERRLIRAACATVFCRSEALAEPLRRAGVDARCAGNVMMDAVAFGQYTPQARRTHRHGVLLLPGSRVFAADNFALQVEALRRLPAAELPDLFLSVADSTDVEALGAAAGLTRTGPLSSEAADLGELSDKRLVIHLSRGALGNLLIAVDVALTQAGTATVQAVGAGVPAICFRTRQDRRSRFRDESNLFGEARLVTASDADEIGTTLVRLLRDEGERQRRGETGRQRVGPPGALAEILQELTGVRA